MSHLPMVPLRDVLTLDLDEVAVEPSAIYNTAGIRNFGRGLFARPAITGASTSYTKYYRLRTHQIVFSRLFAWEGAVALVPPEFDGWFVSSEFPTFTVHRARALPDFLGHLVRWSRFHDQLAGVTRGLGQRRQRVHVEDFLALAIPLPQIDEQSLQVGCLDRTARCARTAAERLGGQSALALVTMLPAFVDVVIQRESAGRARIGNLADFASDIVHPGEDPAPADSFIGLQHIASHTGLCLGSDALGPMKGRKFRFRPGDVVYGYLRPYLNKVWVADRHGLCSVDQYVLRPRPGVSSDLLAHTLRGREVLNRAIDLTHSLQLPRLRSGLLASLEVPTVPERRARPLVPRLDQLRDRVVAAAAKRRHQDELVAALLPSTLNEVFAGLS